MKKTVTWILVADGARARIFKNEGPGKGIQPAVSEEFYKPLPKTSELGADRPGRGHESASTTRHAVDTTDWHRFEKEKFAKEMAGILDQAGLSGAYDRLILVAPPKTLGDLRSALSPATRKKVSGEIDKDLTAVTLGELPDHLGSVLAV